MQEMEKQQIWLYKSNINQTYGINFYQLVRVEQKDQIILSPDKIGHCYPYHLAIKKQFQHLFVLEAEK